MAIDVNSLDPFGDGSLKHFYKLDGNAKDSVGGADLSSSEGDILYENAKFGKAIAFNGRGNVYSNSMNTTLFKDKTPTSLSFWYKDNGSTDNDVHYILSKRASASSDGSQIDLVYSLSTKKLNFSYYSANGRVSLGFTTVFDFTDNLHLITLSMGSDGVVHLYIDGVLKESKGADWSGISNVSQNYLALGSVITDTNADYLPRGTIDHLQIFDRAITQEEVTTLYTGEVTTVPSTQPLSEDNQKSLFKEFYKANKRLLALAFPNLTADLSSISGGGIVVNPRAITIKDGITEDRIKELVAQHIATIPNSQKENSIIYKWNETRPAILGTNVSLNQEKDIGGAYALGTSYASKKDWLFVMDHTNHTMRILKGSNLSIVMSIDTNIFGADTRTFYLTTTPDAKRVAISQVEHGFIRILKLKDDLSGYELESSIDTGAANSIGDLALDGIGSTIVFSANINKQIKIYDLNEQGSWNHNKTYDTDLASSGIEISKDGLEIYISDTSENIRKVTKVAGVWGELVNKFILPDGHGANINKSVSLSLDKQVIYVGDGDYNSYKGRVNVFYKQEDGTWQHKYDIHPTNPVASNYFGIGVALNDDNSVAFISEFESHKVYKYDITVPTILDANSLDPFNDGSLKHFYKLDGNIVDAIINESITLKGTIEYVDAKYNKGIKTSNNGGAYLSKNIFTNDGTMNIWVKPTVYKDDMTVFSTHNVDGASQFVNTLYVMGDGKIQIAGRSSIDDTFTRYKTFDEVVLLNEFTMLTFTKTSNRLEIYKNGVLLGGVDKTSFNTNAFKSWIGYDSIDDNADNTIFDHLQIFDKVLTQEEVTKLYEATVSEVVALTVGYTYDQAIDTPFKIIPPDDNGVTYIDIEWVKHTIDAENVEHWSSEGWSRYTVTGLEENIINVPNPADQGTYYQVATLKVVGYDDTIVMNKTLGQDNSITGLTYVGHPMVKEEAGQEG